MKALCLVMGWQRASGMGVHEGRVERRHCLQALPNTSWSKMPLKKGFAANRTCFSEAALPGEKPSETGARGSEEFLPRSPCMSWHLHLQRTSCTNARSEQLGPGRMGGRCFPAAGESPWLPISPKCCHRLLLVTWEGGAGVALWGGL